MSICSRTIANRVWSRRIADTLDMLAAAVFLLTEDGGIVHGNARATDLLAEKDLLQTIRGRLVLTDAAAATELADAVDCAVLGDAALGQTGRSIACKSRTGRKFVATVMPLTGGRRRAIAD